MTNFKHPMKPKIDLSHKRDISIDTVSYPVDNLYDGTFDEEIAGEFNYEFNAEMDDTEDNDPSFEDVEGNFDYEAKADFEYGDDDIE